MKSDNTWAQNNIYNIFSIIYVDFSSKFHSFGIRPIADDSKVFKRIAHIEL
jgi:hypothetical protein